MLPGLPLSDHLLSAKFAGFEFKSLFSSMPLIVDILANSHSTAQLMVSFPSSSSGVSNGFPLLGPWEM